MGAPLIQIGAAAREGSSLEVAEAIVKILSAPGDQATIQAALRAFTDVASIDGVSFSDCTISSGGGRSEPSAEGCVPHGISASDHASGYKEWRG